MSQQFTERQIEILISLRDKATGLKLELLNKTLSKALPSADIEAVCELINDEYLMKGIQPGYRPNEYGRELESLIDVINRPRLVRK